MHGLCSSWICVPVVSAGSIGPMLRLNNDDAQADGPDNVLLEWIASLELHSRGHLKAIMPIIVADESGEAFDFALPRKLSKEEHTTTTENCIRHLKRKYPTDDSESPIHGAMRSVADVEAKESATVSVSGVVTALLRYQGTVLNDRGDLASITERLHEKCETILNGAHHSHDDE